MANYSKNVLDALTETTFTCSTNVPSTSTICVPGVQPSAVPKNYICIIEVEISVSCNRNLFKVGWIRLGRKGGVWRGTCPVSYVNLYTTCICCKHFTTRVLKRNKDLHPSI
nr:uncharacterized protein LOC105849927 [Hydra vulgaris]